MVSEPMSLDSLQQTSRRMLIIYQAMLRAQAFGAEGETILRLAEGLLRQAGLAFLTAEPATATQAVEGVSPPAVMAAAYARLHHSYAELLDALYRLGIELGQAGNWAAAWPLFAALAELDPALHDAASWHERARTLGSIQQMLKAGDPQGASRVGNAWIKQHSEDTADINGLQRAHLLSLIEWVEVPAGDFLYGDGKKRLNLNAFRMARTPITNSQYDVYVQAAGAPAPSHWRDNRSTAGKGNHPVVNVSWDDAQAFCAWAGLRLPSEQEWEKGARGTDGRAYPWGNGAPSAELCNFGNNVGTTTAVGQYPKSASPFGLLDMAGNVWEWCATPYEGLSSAYVVRGGAYDFDTSWVGCAYRGWSYQHYRYAFFGFRVVCP